MIHHRYGKARLEELLEGYEKSPFMILSDPFAPGYLPKPKLPPSLLGESKETKKQNRQKIWLTPEALNEGRFTEAKTTTQAYSLSEDESGESHTLTMHNSINYQTFTTGEGFDPYAVAEYQLLKKEIYALLDVSRLSVKELDEVMQLLGEHGYGKDTTIGKGRFSTDTPAEVTQPESSTYTMALSPFSPQGIACDQLYYEPFTRFGKSGGDRAHTNPFKKPLLLADTGAVIKGGEAKSFYGQGIKGISTYADTVHQGFTILWPIGGVK